MYAPHELDDGGRGCEDTRVAQDLSSEHACQEDWVR